MIQIQKFDKIVGRIAAAIYTDIAGAVTSSPLMLVPPVTFKVRKLLEDVTNLKMLSNEQLEMLAEDIRVSVVPLLFSLDMDPEVIERVGPGIQSAALKVLTEVAAEPEK
jgi:hypothetical protein